MKNLILAGCLLIYMTGCITSVQPIAQSWSEVKKTINSFTKQTHYDEIVAQLGKPDKEFATPSLTEEYVLYFDVPEKIDKMYWIMLETKTKKYLYWGDEKQKK